MSYCGNHSAPSDEDCFYSENETFNLGYDKVLDKYELKKEVTDYLPKFYVGHKDVIAQEADFNNNVLDTSENLISKVSRPKKIVLMRLHK